MRARSDQPPSIKELKLILSIGCNKFREGWGVGGLSFFELLLVITVKPYHLSVEPYTGTDTTVATAYDMKQFKYCE